MDSPPYCQEFIDFINYSVTAFHAVDYAKHHLTVAGYVELRESEDWASRLRLGGKYFITRNAPGSSLIAFAIGSKYVPGNGLAMVGAHVDSMTLRVKPVTKQQSEKGGFERLAIAPYSGGGASQEFDGSYSTWWDRDLGLAGRVVVKNKDGNVETKLLSIDRPVARIPTLAVHFGKLSHGPFNYETNFVPIVGLTGGADPSSEMNSASESSGVYGPISTRHSEHLLKTISRELGVSTKSLVDFELELFDTQPGTLLGLDKELISSARMDDKMCAFSALWALINTTSSAAPVSYDSNKDQRNGNGKGGLAESGAIQLIALFDNEEISSVQRQGAKSNFLQTVIERVVEAQVGVKALNKSPLVSNLIGQSLSRSYLVSADVTHAFNPNFASVYLEGASPELNVGVALKVDANGHYTTNAVNATLLREVARRCGCELQLFGVRNDSRAGGTIGPMLSQRLGCPTIDVGIPQLSMHSIRGVTGSQDPGLGVQLFEGFLRSYTDVREEMGLGFS